VVTAIYLIGTISILVCIGSQNTNLVTGIIQAISAVLSSVGIGYLTTPIAVLLTLGGLGTLAAWIAGAARLPYSVGVDRYLPQALSKVHPRWGTPYISLLVLGFLSSLIIWISFAGATVKEAYLVLSNACLILYFIPFLYLFVAHLLMNSKGARKLIAYPLAIAGIGSTVIAIVLACIPPADTHAGKYMAQVIGGSFGLVVISMIVFWNANRKLKAASAGK
jgi:amino acid transporter